MKKIAMLLLVAILALGICRFAVGAQTQAAQPVYYENVEVLAGDTLWEIAKKYNHWGTMSTIKYVHYIMDFNHLETDSIRQGQHLIIPVI